MYKNKERVLFHFVLTLGITNGLLPGATQHPAGARHNWAAVDVRGGQGLWAAPDSLGVFSHRFSGVTASTPWSTPSSSSGSP